jgi:16S rRNA (guanine527-N7)-methyltransferase
VEHRDDLSLLLKASAEEIGLTLDSSQIKTFLDYLAQLRRWNQTINLTSITQAQEVIIKHFVDSLAGLRVEPFEQEASVLDIGTGAGFPGIPLKIVRPDLLLTLVEPVSKKVSFLRFLIGLFRFTGISVFEGTIEQFLVDDKYPRTEFDYLVSRALKYEITVNVCGQLLKRNGKAILYLSTPVSEQKIPGDLLIDRYYSFDLPNKYGKRVISVIARSD